MRHNIVTARLASAPHLSTLVLLVVSFIPIYMVTDGGPGLSRAAFVSGALRERCLCRGNASLCRSGAYVETRAADRTPVRGLARPSTEVVGACFAPRMWVFLFLFDLCLRCMALLCGVLVQLHLALFPAGGPFLPSLSVNLYCCSTLYMSTERDGTKGPPAGNKAKCNCTNTPHSKAARRKAKHLVYVFDCWTRFL
jgi:hypothetical protein